MRKLTERQKADLRAAASQKDEDIDFSDIPEIQRLPPNAIVGKFHRPEETSVTPVEGAEDPPA